MSAGKVSVGFFGKLPCRGDFVRVGLSRPVAEAWDRWISASLPNLADASRMPRWRFALGPEVCGPVAVTGVLLPSHDRVGRSFPLLIAAEAAQPSESFLDAVEVIGAAAIRDRWTPVVLINQLDTVPSPTPAEAAADAGARWWRKGGEPAEFAGEAMPSADVLLRLLQP